MRLTLVALVTLLVLPLHVDALGPAGGALSPIGALEEEALHTTLGRIHALRAPLLARPAFLPPTGSFEAEVDLPQGGSILSMTLVRRDVTCAGTVALRGVAPSAAWPDVPALSVTHARVHVDSCPPGLYDLHLAYTTAVGRTEERQVHAVRVMDAARHEALQEGSAQPRIVVLADAHLGDPRGIAQALREAPARAPAAADALLGDGGPGASGRWKALRAALAEARALDPDVVLLAGDLVVGEGGTYSATYEELWRVLAAADVPLFAAPGEHDGRLAGGQDGLAFWRAYVGPTYTFAPTVPGTQLLVLNTYDRSAGERAAALGGQVRAEQLAWAEEVLADARAHAPDARIVALAHHSPATRQDAPESALAEREPAWSGEGRLALRDLLREHGVELVLSGHAHRDRVARDDGAGGIVGTFERAAEDDPQRLHRWDRDDRALEGESQAALAARIGAPTGPLYLTTTPAMGATTHYLGYRALDLAYDSGGRLDLARLGHPLTQEELDTLALRPELANVDHAPLGLFSTPLRLALGAPWSAVPTQSG